ncbi:flavin reductase family protein [Mycobacterium camsae]|uniref:flavin reductase family protein n=1 Tax=Mycobacterium gordonae TaxID=1778 RepID=UPI00197E6738|nr:flavin reductase family protein [Mycobacterium gordonae]
MVATTDRLDGAELRRAFGCFPSGVVALCAMADGVPVGMAASSFTPVSLDPPLVSVCIQHDSTTWPRLRPLRYLGVSVLAEGHDDVCISLSRKTGDRFAEVAWTELPGGAVVVHGSSARLDCRLRDEIPAGDHFIALLEICSLHADPETSPLVFHGSRFRRLSPRERA